MKIVFWVSNMWQDILKIQVLDTTTGLSTINEPMVEDKNCCELAREKFLEEQANYYDEFNQGEFASAGKKAYMVYFEELLGRTNCKIFREVLQETENRNRKKDIASLRPYKNALRFWEECEK